MRKYDVVSTQIDCYQTLSHSKKYSSKLSGILESFLFGYVKPLSITLTTKNLTFSATVHFA